MREVAGTTPGLVFKYRNTVEPKYPWDGELLSLFAKYPVCRGQTEWKLTNWE
jgi:hypothetical protein